MPRDAARAAGDRHAKKPAWLNDPLNYHDRGDIDFGSCSQQCFEQGDFFGLDDLFTEQPNVRERAWRRSTATGSAATRSTASASTRRGTSNAAFFRLWVPRILAAARAAGVPDFQLFGEVFTQRRDRPRRRSCATAACRTCSTSRSRTRGRASRPASAGARGIATGSRDDDYFRLPTASRRRRRPSSATTTWAAPRSRSRPHGAGAAATRCSSASCSAYDLLYLLRGAPVGLLRRRGRDRSARGGDKAARQDMFPTQVARVADRAARRLARRSATARRSTSPTTRSRSSCGRSRRCATRIPRSRRARRSCGSRAGACSPSAGSTPPTRREYVAAFNAGRRRGAGDRRDVDAGATWTTLLGATRGRAPRAAR